ncbi:MAG TPA: class I adenylate-forming enzyme family protein, partial [Acidimicrobiales bacterium]
MGLLIGDVFRNAARAVPERVAAVVGSDSLTFGELDRRSEAIGTELGVGRGDRVALWSGTSLDSVVLFAGLAKAGAVFVPVNPALTPLEAAEVLDTARPSLLAVDRERAAAAAVLAEGAGIRVVESTGVGRE